MDLSDIPSLYSFPSVNISDEDFKLFHNIDRTLFARLVVVLGRDSAESLQLMAFWLWLENEGKDMFLVKKVFSLPAQLVGKVADETVLCLKCVMNENFPFMDVDLELLPIIARKNNNLTSPIYLHHNRDAVTNGVKKIVTEVCFRAFDDILLRMANNQTSVNVGSTEGQTGSFYYPNATPSPSPLGQVSYPPPPHVVGPDHAPAVALPKAGSLPLVVAADPPQMNNGMLDMFSRTMRIVGEEEEGVHPDDRTIFLTFSKGYPISQQEVSDFFSRKFGDSIEAIHMQEVASGEQVLYARLVARSVEELEAIVQGGKAKYNISGKHVWARKYVKKHNSKPPYSSSSSSPASSKP